jgi:hypothetical protein
MGFFAGLNDEKYDRQYADRELTRRMAAYFKNQSRKLAAASLVILLLAAIGAGLPVVVSRMVDLLRDQPSIASIA